MKAKRFFGVFFLTLMLFTAVSGVSAKKWTYQVRVEICDFNSAEAKGKGVWTNLYFDEGDGTTIGMSCEFKDSNKRGGTAWANIEADYDPWRLDAINIDNDTKNSMWMYRIKVDVKNNATGKSMTIFDKYTHTKGDKTKGVTVDKNDGGPKVRKYSFDTGRNLSAANIGNFWSAFDKTEYFDAGGTLKSSTGTDVIEAFTWNQKSTDQYSGILGGSYNFAEYDKAPTMNVWASGKKYSGSIDIATLRTEKIIIDEVANKGFRVNKTKLLDYMNANNINQVTISTSLKFPQESVKAGCESEYIARLVYVRKAVSYSGITFSQPKTDAGNGVRFYTTLDGKITADIAIKNTNNYQMFASNYFDGSKVFYTSATLDIGGKTYEAVETTQKKANSSADSTLTVNGNTITLTFDLKSGMDSKGNGIKLDIKGMMIRKVIGVNDYRDFKFWNEGDNNIGFGTKKNESGYYNSNYKVDCVNPTVAMSDPSKTATTKYHQTIDLDFTVSETPHYANVEAFRLMVGNVFAVTKDALANSVKTVSIKPNADTEGIYTISFDGTDEAGNKINTTFPGIKLDNKKPQVTLTPSASEDGGTKSNYFNIDIKETTGTATLYYMITNRDPKTVENDAHNAKKATSGNLQSFVDEWAYIDQSQTTSAIGQDKMSAADIANLIGSLYITVPKGEVFEGNLVYYVVDEAKNKSSLQSKKIKISNEDFVYSVSSTPAARPIPSYEITVTTNENNSVRYKWTTFVNGAEISSVWRNYNGTIDTLDDGMTKNANGTYYFVYEVMFPSSSPAKPEPIPFVFDNSSPEITFTVPSADSVMSNASIGVRVDDLSYITEATAQIVTPDGDKIDGCDEFSLSIADGGNVRTTLNLPKMPSGAYALYVKATDENGFASEKLSSPFYVRNSSPDGKINVTGELEYNAKRLIGDETVTLDFDIAESFAYAELLDDKVPQSLYYRISTVYGSYGEWKNAGEMTADGDEFKLSVTTEPITLAMSDGEKILYVQTAVCGGNAEKIATDNIMSVEIPFIYDETAPTLEALVINDYHTTESITGKLYVSDNLGLPITAKCDDKNVVIGEFADGAFDITVNDSVNTYITLTDLAGNATTPEEIPLVIIGIDRNPPTATATLSDEYHGERRDVTAVVRIADVLGESVEFAFIPKKGFGGNTIPDEYLNVYGDNPSNFRIEETASEEATRSGEKNITYKVTTSGITGEWYLGVRASDALGNSADIIFDDIFAPEDTELKCTYSVSPKKAEKVAVVTVKFNVPVYVLPQNQILDASDEENLELANTNAVSFADRASFRITEDDDGKYDIFTCDDLGRTKKFVIEITEDDVEFNAASEITATVAKSTWGENGFELIPTTETVSADTYDNYLIVEPLDTETLLLPMGDPNLYYMDVDYSSTHGFRFDYQESEQYAVYRASAPVLSGELADDGSLLSYDADNVTLSGNEDSADGSIKGYRKLIYQINPIVLEDGDYYYYPDTVERVLDLKAFHEDNDPSNPEFVTERAVIVSQVDNTPPVITWTASPNVFTLDKTTGEYVINPTPGSVTYTVTAQDKESGIDEIVVLSYYESEENPDEYLTVPLYDENGEPVEFWEWNGYDHKMEIFDFETGESSLVQIPITVRFARDGDEFGEMTLTYVFDEPFTLSRAATFKNIPGGQSFVAIGTKESGITTEGVIYKLPIEENIDFSLAYYYENADGVWTKITDPATAYYKKAKAVVTVEERGKERALRVTNNNGLNEKLLNIYQNEFTFDLKDKYGYTATVTASLENFDTEPGTIAYSLETTQKTNEPFDVTVTVSDTKSGVAKVVLTDGTNEIPLSCVSDGVYVGEIDKNGIYCITLYDNVGNKSAENFTVKNIDTVTPTATVKYSTKEWTSSPVSAELTFSKPGVKITSVSPIASMSPADYTVNYSTSVITFVRSGSLEVSFEDDYGNTGVEAVIVGNIDKTAPMAEPIIGKSSDIYMIPVTFNKLTDLTSEKDMARKESEIYVSYGGIIKTIANDDGTKNSFVFYENGTYTFKVYDEEGATSFCDVTIDGIDTKAPEIVKVTWTYDFDEYDADTDTWVTKTAHGTKIPDPGTLGYVVATDIYDITNRDVTVWVETDDETRLVGGNTDEYTTVKELVYDKNGMFIFHTEKPNGLNASYGVDIEVIDKTPPVIELIGGNEIIFYENTKLGTFDKSMLVYDPNGKYKAYRAYDVVGKNEVDLTAKVEVVSWGGFDPDNFFENKFDSSKRYTITYRVSDSAHNVTEITRTVRLIGMFDTIALVNGSLPDYASAVYLKEGDDVKLSLSNFSGKAYVRYAEGVLTMGQMKAAGAMLSADKNGNYVVSDLMPGWYTFFIQTDKRDYFTIYVSIEKQED